MGAGVAAVTPSRSCLRSSRTRANHVRIVESAVKANVHVVSQPTNVTIYSTYYQGVHYGGVTLMTFFRLFVFV